LDIYIAPFDPIPRIVGIKFDTQINETQELVEFEDLEEFFTVSEDEAFQPILVVSEKEDYFCLGKSFSEVLEPEPGIFYFIPKDCPYPRVLGSVHVDVIHVHEVAINNNPIDLLIVCNVEN